MNKISVTMGSALPVASAASLMVAAYKGRQFCLAASYKLGSFAAQLLRKQNVAEWDKESANYWTSAKKDIIRDLPAIASFTAISLFAGYAAKVYPIQESMFESFKETMTTEFTGIPLLAKLATIQFLVAVRKNLKKNRLCCYRRNNVYDLVL
jgi:hypothetical protein